MSNRRRGFTLLELLVVLVVMAITAVAAAPAFLSDTRASAEQRTATAIADGLRRARQAARESGAPSTLSMDGRYWITTRDSVLSGNVPLAAGSTLIGRGGERMQCRFEASGPASPIAITAHGTTDVTVIVDEWSGEIGIGNAKAS
jgi:type II secretion system protein H